MSPIPHSPITVSVLADSPAQPRSGAGHPDRPAGRLDTPEAIKAFWDKVHRRSS